MAEKHTTNTQIYRELQEIKQILAERRHIDVKVMEHAQLLDGNGRPGFKQIRDKVLQWDSKINTVILVVISDIVFRLIQFAFK